MSNILYDIKLQLKHIFDKVRILVSLFENCELKQCQISKENRYFKKTLK